MRPLVMICRQQLPFAKRIVWVKPGNSPANVWFPSAPLVAVPIDTFEPRSP